MILSTAQRLAAMKGLDVDRARGNARGSVMNMQWPGGVMIYDIATKIGEDKWSKDRYEKRVKQGYLYCRFTSLIILLIE